MSDNKRKLFSNENDDFGNPKGEDKGGRLMDLLDTGKKANIKYIRSSSGRSRSMLVLVLILFAVCLLQLADIQLIEGADLAKQAIDSRTYKRVIPAKRGDILDRNGKVLATSLEVYDVAVNQKQVKDYVDKRLYDHNGRLITDKNKQELGDPRNTVKIEGYGAEAAARRIAPLLHTNAAQLGGLMVGNRGFVYLAKGVKPEVYRQIMRLEIDGITGKKRFIRSYPNGSLASSILGFVDYKYEGAAGIELSQNKVLAGSPGLTEVEMSDSGQLIPGGYNASKEAKTGSSIKLTIDADIQAVAETALNARQKETEAEWGTVIVEDVHTGEILALADSGNKPPYETRNADNIFQGSRAVQYAYEPGSVGKTITMATALKEKKVNPGTAFEVPYQQTFNGQRFQDAFPHPLWKMTTSGILEKSSNIGMIQIGNLVTSKQRYAMMRNLGLGKKTGIELPGEATGYLGNPDDWDVRSRLVNMIGQAYSVTSVQMAAVFSTYAANGVYHSPRIVLGVQNDQGLFQARKPNAPQNKISADNAATLVKMMRGVVTPDGYAAKGVIPGYWSAGKTGTAEIISPRGAVTGVITSLIGITPADKPRLVVATTLYKPKKATSGGAAASPVYREVAEFALKKLNIPPNSGKEDFYPVFAN